MTPDVEATSRRDRVIFNEGIGVGKTFRDPETNVQIKTTEINPGVSATVEVTLSGQDCIRRDPTFTITPTNTEEEFPEFFEYDFELINNDASICSNREIYHNPFIFSLLITEDSYLSARRIYPTVIRPGEIISGSMEVNPIYYPLGHNEISIDLYDVEKDIYASEIFSFDYEQKPPSVIKNTGSSKIIGDLVMKLKKFDGVDWKDSGVIVNQRLEIPGNSQKELSDFWGDVFVGEAKGAGDYQAYVSFSVGGSSYVSEWEFDVVGGTKELVSSGPVVSSD